MMRYITRSYSVSSHRGNAREKESEGEALFVIM